MFNSEINRFNEDKSDPAQWVFAAPDQITDKLGPLSDSPVEDCGLIMVEAHESFARRPYHRQKLALVIANMRHFALEQSRLGRKVIYLINDRPVASTLAKSARELGPLIMMEAAELELRNELSELIESGTLCVMPHEGWLTTINDLEDSHNDQDVWRMDRFYRHVRQRTGILMKDRKPIGGKYSHDGDNRSFWDGKPEAPELPQFKPDEITTAVFDLVEDKFARHPGEISKSFTPATVDDAETLWQWCLDNCMKSFGPYEDAMSTLSSGIFHTRISSLLNLHRLLPARVVSDVEKLDIPINSKEGFIRQILGWREFVNLIHKSTNGFRELNTAPVKVMDKPGDGGYALWADEKWREEFSAKAVDGGATPGYFQARSPLPPAYWGKESGLKCLDSVVADVWKEAYSHHITRLMVLSNIATLLDINPRELTDWFWIAYSDAWDWVVEPNVLAMGTHSTGDIMTTKPYISGANYINKMSNFCKQCRFNPAKNCPVTNLYWAFLNRHQEKLDETRRMFMPLNSLKKRSDAKKIEDKNIFEIVRTKLLRGERLTVEDLSGS